MGKKEDKREKKKSKQYSEDLATIRRREESNIEQFDRTAVYIAAGATYFSITYRAKYAKMLPLCNDILLDWTIGLFLATLCLSLFSFLASNIVFRRLQKKLDQYHATEKRSQDGVWEYLADHLPKVYGGLLIITLILAGFAILGDFTAPCLNFFMRVVEFTFCAC